MIGALSEQLVYWNSNWAMMNLVDRLFGKDNILDTMLGVVFRLMINIKETKRSYRRHEKKYLILMPGLYPLHVLECSLHTL